MPNIFIGASIGISKKSRAFGLIQKMTAVLSAGIAFQQRGCPYTHVFIADNRQDDAFTPDRLRVAEAWHPHGFRIGPWREVHTPGTPYDIWAVEVTGGQYDAWWKLLAGWVGTPYDFWALLGFLARSKGQADAEAAERLFCSEAAALALKHIEVPAFNWKWMKANFVSPWLLMTSPLFAGGPVYSYRP